MTCLRAVPSYLFLSYFQLMNLNSEAGNPPQPMSSATIEPEVKEDSAGREETRSVGVCIQAPGDTRPLVISM